MKRTFMLDTNALQTLLERRSPALDHWFAEERCSISAVVAAEVRFGLARQRLTPERQRLVERLLETIRIEPFDAKAASSYGQLRATLASLGTPLAAMDLLIASHALSLNKTLVSSDQAFSSVQALTCIDPLQTGGKMG